MKTFALLFATTLALVGCKTTADKPGPPAAATTDHITVLAKHLPAAGQPDLDADPVVVRLESSRSPKPASTRRTSRAAPRRSSSTSRA